MALRLITAPAVEPISLTEAKAHLRINHTDQDTLIELYIKAATAYVDGENGFLGRALVTQTWELVIDEFPTEGEILLPLPPLQSVTSIEYDDGDGLPQTLATSEYTVDTVSEPGWVTFGEGGWPTTFDGINAVRIRYVAGYSPSSDSPPDLTANVPASIKAAMLLLIGSMFANREQTIVGVIASQLPFGVEQLLRPYRIQRGMA